MEYRPLGRTGVQVSSLCLGCMMFGAKTSLEDSCAIVGRTLDAGINFLDTSNSYSRGRSEEFTGEALKRSGKRSRVILATKVHSRMDNTDPNGWGNSRRHIIAQCEESLRRLQTDYIDLYQIHRPLSTVPIDETLRALDDLIRSGKVRYAGTSTFGAWQLVESLWVAKELGLNRFICEQPPYNLLDRRIERELLPMARTYGFAVIPWSPIAGGLLSGKYTRNAPPPPDSRYAGEGASNPRYSEGMFAAVEQLQSLAGEKGIPLARLALAWVLQQPGVTSPIIGPRTLEQLEDYFAAQQVTFSAEELARIDTISPPGRMISPFYQADFGPHLFRV